MRERVYLALGSNLGDRDDHLARAREGLHALPGATVLAVSPPEETTPLGGLEQPAYRNQMVCVETTLAPEALLDACQAIEAALGRVRDASARWASRTIDIDLVLWVGRTIDVPRLRVPHPELAHREFWHRGLAALGVPWNRARAAAATRPPVDAAAADASPIDMHAVGAR
jgi:2-amino-4-hydroxy-6-hydroxymethyldihydropteridine diphosphokinase